MNSVIGNQGGRDCGGEARGASLQANMARIRESRPDSGPVFQVKVLTTFQVVPSSLGSGSGRWAGGTARVNFACQLPVSTLRVNFLNGDTHDRVLE